MTPPKDSIRKYGGYWDPKLYIHPAQIDLALYANDELREAGGKNCLSKADHLRAAIKQCLPEHVFSLRSRWSNDIIDAWCDNLITTIWGSSSSGKSGTVAGILLFDLLAAPSVTKVSLSTSPLKMHDERAWGSLKKWHSNLPDPLRIGRIMKAPTPALLTVDKEGQVAGVVCISTAEGESAEDLKSKIGAHQKRNRFAVDEPQKASESILSVKANFGASGEYKEIFFGNPDSWFSPLGKHSLPHCLLDGTPASMKDIEEKEPKKFRTKQIWRGTRGICVVLDGRDSPGIEDPTLEYLPAQAHLDDLVTNFGEDSMQYWTYGIGRMPPSGSTGTLISAQDIENSGALEDPENLAGPLYTLAGLDPSEGGDGVILTRARFGTNSSGHMACAILNSHAIQVKISKGDVSGQIATAVHKKLREWSIPIKDFSCDATGNQGAVIDRIEQTMGQRGAYRMLSSGSGATKNKISASGDRANDHYSDKNTEILHNGAALVLQGRVTGLTAKIAMQMSSRRVESDGKIKAEAKKLWKLRNEGLSPDEMDSFNCTIQHAIQKKIIRPYIGVIQPRQNLNSTNPFDPIHSQRGKRNSTMSRRRRASNAARRR